MKKILKRTETNEIFYLQKTNYTKLLFVIIEFISRKNKKKMKLDLKF